MEQHHCESLYRDFCKPRFDRVEKALDDIRNALTGNGHTGLVHRIVALETQNQAKSQSAAKVWAVIAPVISALLIAAVSWMASEIMRQRQQLDDIYQLKTRIKQYLPEGLKEND